MSTSSATYGWELPTDSDPANLPPALAALAADIEGDMPVRSKGKAIISSEQSTASTSYALLGTPDRVQNIVLPTDGLIFVIYRALVRNDAGAGVAGLFLNNTLIRSPALGSAPISQDSLIGDSDYQWLLSSHETGLRTPSTGSASSDDGTTTGMIVGNGAVLGTPSAIVAIEAAAGTYDVAVKFKAFSGITYAKDRRLRVWSQVF
jgi:hypothetical protein